MDLNKLTVKIKEDKFYQTYTAALRSLYTQSFIHQNHLQPENMLSFSRMLTGRTGVNKTAEYSKELLQKIVEGTNNKVEEYLTGNYEERTRALGEKRYRIFSSIMKETLKMLGYEDLADDLKYLDKEEEDMAKKKTVVAESFDELKDALARAVDEHDEEKEEPSVIKTINDQLDAFNKKKSISAKEKMALKVSLTKLDEALKSLKKKEDAMLIDKIEKLKSRIMGFFTDEEAPQPATVTQNPADVTKPVKETAHKETAVTEHDTEGLDIAEEELLAAVQRFIANAKQWAKDDSEEIKVLQKDNKDLTEQLTNTKALLEAAQKDAGTFENEKLELIKEKQTWEQKVEQQKTVNKALIDSNKKATEKMSARIKELTAEITELKKNKTAVSAVPQTSEEIYTAICNLIESFPDKEQSDYCLKLVTLCAQKC